MSNQFYIYIHCKPSEDLNINSIFYVGKGTGKRAYNLHRNTHHSNVVKKHGMQNIIVKILHCASEEAAHQMEINIISVLKRLGVNLTNKTDGGEGISGYSHTEENKLKMSILKRGKPISQEHKDNIQAVTIDLWKDDSYRSKKLLAMDCRWAKPSERLKISNVIKGTKHTEQSKGNMSQGAKKRYESVEQRTLTATKTKEQWADPVMKEKMRESLRQGWIKRKANKELLNEA